MAIHLRKSDATRLEQWLETLVITCLAVAAGFVLHRNDPFFTGSEFPWIWLGPLLVALRYGIAPGMASVGVICIAFLAMQRTGLIDGEFPLVFMLGGTLMTLVCGQFSTVWSQRLRRAHQLSSHASERFQQLSRAYFMVRLSHDRLEQNLISRPVTLRDAMKDLRTMLAQHAGNLDDTTAPALLALLVHYCNIESAAIYPADNSGRILPQPLASCGKGASLSPHDLLLRSAIESGNTAYQSANRLSPAESSAYLVSAPLRTSRGNLLGVLLITEMPFLSLQRETLQIMGVLIAYAADQAESAAEALGVVAVMKDCPINFAAEMIKMVTLRRDLEVSSALVAVNIQPDPRIEEICSILERQQRGLDHTWRRDLDDNVQFVTLMPFSGAASVEGFRNRLDRMLQDQFGKEIGRGGITVRSAMLTTSEPLQQLADLLAER